MGYKETSTNVLYDRNIIVAGTSHAHHVKEHVPQWWGIITLEVDDSGTILLSR